MSRTNVQALLDELQQYTNALLLADKPVPIDHVSRAVAGGPALLVENASVAYHSMGIEECRVQCAGVHGVKER